VNVTEKNDGPNSFLKINIRQPVVPSVKV